MAPPKDFTYLLKPEIYHPLPTQTIPAPFRTSAQQPSPDTPIPDLLAQGHFRGAAIAAVNALTGTPPPESPARIFELLYTRLSCLTLIEATQIAAQEARALEDINSAAFVDEVAGEHLVPWELRVLVVRLQAMGFGDPRRAVMSYYDLAREARARIAAAAATHDHSASELWKERLVELGMKVAGALVEMDDLAGAAGHLAGLRERGDGKLAMAKALLWLHLGDTDAARQCVKEGEAGDKIIGALCEMANGNYESALSRWKELREEMAGDEMVSVNLAVCLLYIGKMDEVSISPPYCETMCTDCPAGEGSAGGTGGERTFIAYSPIQSLYDVRAMYRQIKDSEGQSRCETSCKGGYVQGLGKVQRRLQIMSKDIRRAAQNTRYFAEKLPAGTCVQKYSKIHRSQWTVLVST